MMLPKIVWATVAAALLLTPLVVRCQQAPTAARNALTQTQAIQRAADFCKAIGKPVTTPGTAAPAAATQSPILTPEYWRPGWLVHFGPDTEIGVADTGVIYRYFASTSAGSEGRPVGRVISRETALARSAAVLAATHVTEPLAPPQAHETRGDSSRRGDPALWWIFRQRQVQGIAFGDQHTAVLLKAETGEVQELAVCFSTPLPAPVKPVITQAQAIKIGQEFLARGADTSAGYRPSGLTHLVWITPETRSERPVVNGVVDREPAPTRAAALPPRLTWTCPYGDNYGDHASMPVDVVTGKVIPYGIAFSYASLRLPPRPADFKPAPEPPFPPEPVIDRDVVATTVPGATAPAALPPSVPWYRLSLTDIYIPITALEALGYDSLDPDLGGNATTAQSIAGKLEQAARAGTLRLVAGPTATVPEGGVWGLTRTRATLCRAPLYWAPRLVPARIGMWLTIMPTRQADGRIGFRFNDAVKALAAGETWPGGDSADKMQIGRSWGDPGATTLLCALPEECYTGTAKEPGQFRTVGVMHVILVRAVPL